MGHHYPSSSTPYTGPPRVSGPTTDGASDKKCRCCKICTIFLVLLVLIGLGGVLIWQFLPQATRESIREGAGDTTDSLPDVDLSGEKDFSQGPSLSYQFDYCDSCCNGLPSLCDMPANEIMYASLHNGMAAVENGFYVGGNHDFSLERALEAGFRGINMDMHKCEGDNGQSEIQLVHGFCRFGQRDPVTVFSNIREFLVEHPREVLIIPIEIVSKEGAVVTIPEIYDVLERADVTSLMYEHDPRLLQWPTLQELIDTNKRILFFHYNGPACGANCPASMHDYFTYAAETEFSFEDVSDIDDKTNSCTITRGNGGRKDFFGLNLFVSNPFPSKSSSEVLNQKQYLQDHIEQCAMLTGLNPNMLFVDFWDQGDVVEAIQLYNQNIVTTRRHLRTATR